MLRVGASTCRASVSVSFPSTSLQCSATVGRATERLGVRALSATPLRAARSPAIKSSAPRARRRLACSPPSLAPTKVQAVRTVVTVNGAPPTIAEKVKELVGLPHQVWTYFLRGMKLKMGVATFAFGAVVYGYYTQTEGYLQNQVVEAFERGAANSSIEKIPANFIDRPVLHRALAAEMRPSADRVTYTFVVGPRGVGKTTAVLSAIRELEGKTKGVVYFDCRTTAETPLLARKLADVVGWHKPIRPMSRVRLWLSGETREDRQPGRSDEPWASWDPLAEVLIEVGKRFQQKHGRPMVLVVDAADTIAKKNPDFLLALQEFAKVCADQRVLKVIFVASEGRALELMERQSAWSRASRPFEVGDLSSEAAVQFLVEMKIDKAQAEEAVDNLCGGRFADLLQYLDDVSKGQSNEQIRLFKDNDVKYRLRKAGISAQNPFFRALVDTKDNLMDGDSAASALGGDDKVEALLQHNILTVNANHFVSFHDRHALDYFMRSFNKKR